jgi:hypothetical protein
VWYPSSTSNGMRHGRWLRFNAERGHSRWHNPNPTNKCKRVYSCANARWLQISPFGRLWNSQFFGMDVADTNRALHLCGVLQPNIALHVGLRDAGCVRSRLKYNRMNYSSKMTRNPNASCRSSANRCIGLRCRTYQRRQQAAHCEEEWRARNLTDAPLFRTAYYSRTLRSIRP